ncbi:hypothetical protein RRG08_056878 [Elysia crispata]|uniref:Uncharacterized protein n=1 Tax=Elysia crispata TaxID=231223 RepID=A0AAE0ZCR8_9GAST|nr:hypothetical protein RRG08_056878 [Elysia crispata]
MELPKSRQHLYIFLNFRGAVDKADALFLPAAPSSSTRARIPVMRNPRRSGRYLSEGAARTTGSCGQQSITESIACKDQGRGSIHIKILPYTSRYFHAHQDTSIHIKILPYTSRYFHTHQITSIHIKISLDPEEPSWFLRSEYRKIWPAMLPHPLGHQT